MYYKFDVVIVGSGGAGLMAAMQLPNASVAVLSKVYPTRSHTGAAQGGVAVLDVVARSSRMIGSPAFRDCPGRGRGDEALLDCA